jgi:uncharacterized RmlC-like cupin family protein
MEGCNMKEGEDIMKVSISQAWDVLALHSAEQRNWTRVGEGMELSIVGRDAKTGATALFERVRKTEKPELEAIPHVHSVACQTLVLSGNVEIAFGADTNMLNAGDYLRVPPGVPHTQSVISDDAVMFVMTDGNPGIEFVVPEPWPSQ